MDEQPTRGRRQRRQRRRDRAAARTGARWKRRTLIAAISIVTVMALLAGGSFAYVEYRFHQIHKVTVHHLVPVTTTGPHANAQTILMIGSTSRCALNGKQAGSFGSCAAGVTGVNSDVIMLLHVDPATHRVSVLSLPRDLALENVRPGEFHKVDAALADGPSQLVAVIEQDFGIPINHFVELNFDSFQNVVNALGGLYMDFPVPVADRTASLDIPTAGCHFLNGFEALAVVRARHMSYGSHLQYYDGTGDLGRIVRDHEFLRVLAAAVSKRGLGNLATDNGLLGAVAPQLTIDSTFSISDMVSLLWNFHGVNPASAPQTTLPNIEDFTDYIYQGYDYGSVVFPSYPADQRAIDSFLGLSAPPTATLHPSAITVAVVDGSGVAGTAAATATALSAQGYRATVAGEQAPVGSPAETLVEYTAPHLADAERLAQSLSGIVSMAEVPAATAGADVTLIAGTTFRVVKPGRHQVGVPSGISTLSPVSSAAQSLPAYDPRACAGK
jgi:LCP family protein required for cell wall assembly